MSSPLSSSTVHKWIAARGRSLATGIQQGTLGTGDTLHAVNGHGTWCHAAERLPGPRSTTLHGYSLLHAGAGV